MDLTQELKELLRRSGAALVGVGDMGAVPGSLYPRGISVALPLPKAILQELREGPNKAYYDLYHEMNHTLNEIVLAGEKFLIARGYDGYAQTTSRVTVDQQHRSALPHKTVATRAGLGWIGKNCLLVTTQYGSAVRISSLLTNAPLVCDEPIQKSRCGSCSLCVQNCPGEALRGTLWTAGTPREDMVDAERCYQTQLKLMKARTGIETDLCGKCFALCAYTRKYLRGNAG